MFAFHSSHNPKMIQLLKNQVGKVVFTFHEANLAKKKKKTKQTNKQKQLCPKRQ